jgi:hypothetical protein
VPTEPYPSPSEASLRAMLQLQNYLPQQTNAKTNIFLAHKQKGDVISFEFDHQNLKHCD